LTFFVGGVLIAWVVGTATLLQDVYEEIYFDPDTGTAREDDQMNEFAEEGEVSHAALVSAIIGYCLGPLMLLYGYQIEPLVIVSNALISSGAGNIVMDLQNVSTVLLYTIHCTNSTRCYR
jgi:hypothetical protein